MKKEVRLTWHFPHTDPKQVWEHLTQPDLLAEWLMYADIAPVVGHKFGFHGSCNDEAKEKAFAHCEVLEVVPHQKLVYSWSADSMVDGKPFDSTVTWSLRPEQNGTELQLVHDGFRAEEDALAHKDGWTRIGKKITETANAKMV